MEKEPETNKSRRDRKRVNERKETFFGRMICFKLFVMCYGKETSTTQRRRAAHAVPFSTTEQKNERNQTTEKKNEYILLKKTLIISRF